MEFLSLSRRGSSARNVPSGEERGEADVFAGYGLVNNSELHALYGIQAFAKCKRPEYTGLHLREL